MRGNEVKLRMKSKEKKLDTNTGRDWMIDKYFMAHNQWAIQSGIHTTASSSGPAAAAAAADARRNNKIKL